MNRGGKYPHQARGYKAGGFPGGSKDCEECGVNKVGVARRRLTEVGSLEDRLTGSDVLGILGAVRTLENGLVVCMIGRVDG